MYKEQVERIVDSVRISKLLSLVLRHKPEAVGLTLDAHGWVGVNDLLSAMKSHGYPVDRAQLERVVESSNKKRFTIAENRIRANQGHSVDVDLDLIEAAPPTELYHGTSTRFLASILDRGLEKMARHHVHLSSDSSTASTVGERHGKLVLLRVDAKRMTEDGHVFFLSANGVWLVDRVPVNRLEIVGGDT